MAVATACAAAAADSAMAATGDWRYLARCPVDDVTMLSAPAGPTSYCVTIYSQGTSFNVGSAKTGSNFELDFGVAGAPGGPGSVVMSGPSGFYTVPPLGPQLPYVDFCSIYPEFSVYWRLCESGVLPPSQLNEFELAIEDGTSRLANVAATLKLTGTASDFDPAALSSPGESVLTLPIKVKLDGPMLGKNC